MQLAICDTFAFALGISCSRGGSYTTFKLHGLGISPKNATANGTFNLTFSASNTGKRDGATPIQVR
jgi:hypothetical protein